MAAGDKIKWIDADFKWSLAPTDPSKTRYTWNDVKVIQEAVGGGDMVDDMPWLRWDNDDERKKKLVKLICKVQGKTITTEKEIQQYKISIKDVTIVAKEVLGIEIMTENIKF